MLRDRPVVLNFIPTAKTSADLTCSAFREHDPRRLGIESSEQFWNQARFDGAGFTWRHEITDNRIDPSYFIDAKNDSGMGTNFKLVNWRPSQQLPKNFNSFHYFFDEFFFYNLLHHILYYFQHAQIDVLKFDFVPDIRKERP